MSRIDPERWRAITPHLEAALDLTAEERGPWLSELAARDPRVADELRALLAAHASAQRQGFLDENFAPGEDTSFGAGTPGGSRDDSEHAAPRHGHVFGAYTLVSPLGAGGMGSVWLAHRSDGRFEGRAAVKLLNVARLGRAGEERFAREGTILARLTHPRIAHLIDAGVSPDGQPYLVLEHVDGQPIDRYCDERALDVPARIRLLLDVLDAVAYAHANLVVHRDLKPSNVLVSTGGQIKLLDFGIAKLLDDDVAMTGTGSRRPELTREHGVGLTPEYAAPEQVNDGVISTTTDVFALGVLAYVLLTGQHPSGSATRSPAELFRAIVDSEPPRPSDIVGNARRGPEEELVRRAAKRSSTPHRLRRQLQGDLDTIVGKALNKEPGKRYASVTAFADDLRRHLDSEPIAARPDTFSYRAGKFLRRNPRPVAATTLALLAFIAVAAFHTWQVSAERDRARYEAGKAAKVIDLLSRLFTGADPLADKREPTVRGVLDSAAAGLAKDLAGQSALEAEILPVVGRIYQRLGAYDRAQDFLDRGVAAARGLVDHDRGEPGEAERRLAAGLTELGTLRRERSDAAGAIAALTEAIALYRRPSPPPANPMPLARALLELARSERASGRLDAAKAHVRESLEIRRRTLGQEHGEVANALTDLVSILWQEGDAAGAESLARQALAIARKAHGPRHAKTAAGINNLAVMLAERGEYAETERLLRESLSINREIYGDAHPTIVRALGNLGEAAFIQGRFGEARALLEESLRIGVRTLGDADASVANSREAYAQTLLALHEDAAGERELRQVIASRARQLPQGNWQIASAESLLGEALTRRRHFPEAEEILLRAAAVLKDTAQQGPQGRAAVETRQRLAALYEAWGRRDMVARYR